MDKIISSGAFLGATIGITPHIYENPSWQNYVLIALGGALIGFVLAIIINKIKKVRKNNTFLI